MNKITKYLPDDIKLLNPKNPLSAVGDNGKNVYKFSFHPQIYRLLYCYPGQFHADAIEAAGDSHMFGEYVRVIYDLNNNVAGSRVWGEADFYNKNEEVNIKSFNAQYTTFKFLKQFDAGLKWILNLTNNDLDSREALNALNVSKNRILNEDQMEELKKNFKMIYKDKKLNEYWGIQKMGHIS